MSIVVGTKQGAFTNLTRNIILGIQHLMQSHRALRWGIYSVAIGIASGLMACLVFFLLEWSAFFALEYLAGYHVAKPAGEHLIGLVADSTFRPWLLFILPAVGGLLSGLIVYTYAPEAEGHGTDAFIDAFHNKQGVIRARVPFIKGLASIITLATGGSAGREGPIAQIGAGIGSWLGRTFKMNVRERRLMLLAGCAGGLGAIFRAPLGGALTAIEVLYRDKCAYCHHAGADAVGPSLRGVVPVNDILIPPAADPDSDGFHASEALLGGREPRVVCAGESVAVGGVRLDIVYPPAAAATSENENETSLIILATYGGTRVLLTGDAEKGVLEPLVCSGAVGRVDVLKVGHHASRISLSEEMLTTMRPTWALISVGAGNRFGHPTPTALGLLRSAGVRVGRTDLEGDLTVAFDARGYRVTFGRHSAAVVAEGPTIGCQWLSPGSRCAKLVRHVVRTTRDLRDLEPDGRFARGPETRLPHIWKRGPPARAGPRSAPQPGSGSCRPGLQLRDVRFRQR